MMSSLASIRSTLDLPSLCTIQFGHFALQGVHCNVTLESSYLRMHNRLDIPKLSSIQLTEDNFTSVEQVSIFSLLSNLRITH